MPRALLCVLLLVLPVVISADSLDDAEKALRSGDAVRAKAAFQKAVSDLSDGSARHASALAQLITLETESGVKRLRLRQYIETYPANPHTIDCRWELYYIYLGSFLYTDALRTILPLADHAASRERALAALAVLSLELGKASESLAYLDAFFREYRTSGLAPRMLLCRAEVRLMQGDTPRAKNDYEELLAKHKSDPLAAAAYLALADLAGNAGNTKDARALFDALIAAFPNSFEASLARGRRAALPAEAKEVRDVRVWEVQLAAFFVPGQAETFVKELSSKGYVSFVDDSMENGRRQYSVRMGYYRTRNDAELVMKELASKGYQGFIRTRTIKLAVDEL
jgi:tetratricopeptide (TPR) repeat protein